MQDEVFIRANQPRAVVRAVVQVGLAFAVGVSFVMALFAGTKPSGSGFPPAAFALALGLGCVIFMSVRRAIAAVTEPTTLWFPISQPVIVMPDGCLCAGHSARRPGFWWTSAQLVAALEIAGADLDDRYTKWLEARPGRRIGRYAGPVALVALSWLYTISIRPAPLLAMALVAAYALLAVWVLRVTRPPQTHIPKKRTVEEGDYIPTWAIWIPMSPAQEAWLGRELVTEVVGFMRRGPRAKLE